MNAFIPKPCIHFIFILLLFGCSKKQIVSESEIIENNKYYRGQKIESIPKVATVDLI